jgi:predicted metal-dependent hydrolase
MEQFHTQIILNQKTVPYSVRYSNRAHRYRILVSQSGVELVLPEGTPLSKAPELMRNHADWLLHHLSRLERSKAKYNQNQLPQGTILLEGIPHQVKTNYQGRAQPSLKILAAERILELTVPQGRSNPLHMLEAILQKQSRVKLKKLVRQRASQLKLQFTNITIRDQRTRWGSCSSKGTISLNWRLIMAPPEVLDYVIVHELSHLVEHNHSKRFWLLVQQNCPNFNEFRLWLKVNGPLLRPVL